MGWVHGAFCEKLLARVHRQGGSFHLSAAPSNRPLYDVIARFRPSLRSELRRTGLTGRPLLASWSLHLVSPQPAEEAGLIKH